MPNQTAYPNNTCEVAVIDVHFAIDCDVPNKTPNIFKVGTGSFDFTCTQAVHNMQITALTNNTSST